MRLGSCAALSVLVAALSAPDGVALARSSADAPLMQRHLVEIEGGRRLNFVCAGKGSPTLVFEDGLGANLLTWQKVIGPVSQVARACFYDRAGYGYSDPPGGASTAANAADDLHHLLRRAHIGRPVVLVAHSLGGLYATLYADRYPDDVAGLVLIDPSFAEQDKDEDASERAKDEITFRDSVARLHACADLARAGKLISEKHGECFGLAPDRTPKEKSFLTYQAVRPNRYEAMASEATSLHSPDGRSDIDSLQEISERRSFGVKPVIVLTASLAEDANAAASDRAIAEHDWQSWKAGHDALAARSGNGKSTVIAATSHFIQIDQPSAVVSAIEDVVTTLRQDQR